VIGDGPLHFDASNPAEVLIVDVVL